METKKLKTNLSNVPFQSQFLPLIQSAEVEIKKLVHHYALFLKSKTELRNKIHGIIKAVDKRLPISLIDRQEYLNALYRASEKMIREFYDVMVARYFFMLTVLAFIGIKKKPKNVIELIKVEKENVVKIEKAQRELWSKAKGTPYVENYGKLLTDKVKELAQTQTTTESGISIWQKAELDIRHENQMIKLNEIRASGVQYAWTSSHPDCSKRCEKWQGKLYDIQAQHSELTGHRMRKKVDGHTVYCLEEVLHLHQYGKNGKDYGENSIINGYNCRHHLIPYNGQVPPEEYTEKEVREQREINAKLRDFERQIRFHKQQALLYNVSNPKLSKWHEREAKRLTLQYKQYAERNGFAYYDYRIKI